MLFVIIGWDAPGSRELRPNVRPAHLEYWKDWDEAGRVIIAGPMTDFAGSLFIVEADSQEVVAQKAAADPYFTSGVFARFEVHPFRGVLPTRVYGS